MHWALVTYYGFTEQYKNHRLLFSLIATNPKWIGKGYSYGKNGFNTNDAFELCKEEMIQL